MKRQSIAMIEDEPSHATLLKYNLENRGYDVTHYEMGKDFLKDSSCHRFKLIIINAQITDINGLELKNKIREKKVSCPILFLTTEKIEDIRMDSEGIAYFGKPFKITSLMNKVEKLIWKKSCRLALAFNTELPEAVHWTSSSLT